MSHNPPQTSPQVPVRSFFFLQELARHLKVSTRTIQRAISDEEFPKPSGYIRCRPYWLQEVIDHWLEEGGSRSG